MAAEILVQVDHAISQGHIESALIMLQRAGDAGDGDALFRMAITHLVGDIVPRDLRLARSFLSRAVATRHADAALMEVALCANGSGAKADWRSALSMLERAAQSDPVAADQLKLVQSMTLNESGYPVKMPAGRQLSQTPHVIHFKAFLTPEECLHLARTADPLFEPALVIDSHTGRTIPHPVRSSEEAVIGPTREDLAIRAINTRVAAVSNTDVAAGEALTVLRYGPGQQYRPHHDAIAGTTNQRGWTMLIYLNENYSGGQTRFFPSGLTVRGQRGDALLFRNLLQDGSPDPAAQHAGLPVTAGHKWLATRWIRQQPLDLWAQGR